VLLLILCAYVTAFRLGLGPIPWFISTELLPADRDGGSVQSATAAFSWVVSFAVVKSFKAFVVRDPVALWCSFAAYSAAGLAFVYAFVPETNGKSREQIRAELAGNDRDERPKNRRDVDRRVLATTARCSSSTTSPASYGNDERLNSSGFA